jgi:hypothetical protein
MNARSSLFLAVVENERLLSVDFQYKKSRAIAPGPHDSPKMELHQKWQDATPRFCRYFWWYSSAR